MHLLRLGSEGPLVVASNLLPGLFILSVILRHLLILFSMLRRALDFDVL